MYVFPIIHLPQKYGTQNLPDKLPYIPYCYNSNSLHEISLCVRTPYKYLVRPLEQVLTMDKWKLHHFSPTGIQ